MAQSRTAEVEGDDVHEMKSELVSKMFNASLGSNDIETIKGPYEDASRHTHEGEEAR